MTESYTSLTEAAKARRPVWDPELRLTPTFYAIEMLGEFGEMCNVVKKLMREDLNVAGSRATLTDLRDELADVYITVANLRIVAEIPEPSLKGFTEVWAELRGAKEVESVLGMLVMFMYALATPYLLEDTINNELGEPPIEDAYTGAVVALNILSEKLSIDLRKAVIDKFNATSTKMQLPIFLYEHASI